MLLSCIKTVTITIIAICGIFIIMSTSYVTFIAGNGEDSGQQQQQQQQQQPITMICPDGSQPDANGNCPTSTTTNNQQLAPPSSTPSEQHHHKGKNLSGGRQ
jgi:hypothetical protein